MINEHRATLYRVTFALAAIYNIALGLWASLWPGEFFRLFELAQPNYPGLWRCLGMVLGLYGILYAYAAWRLDRAYPIIAVGLAGKILGPIGWLMVVNSGEWPVRTFTLIAFDDLAWWLPFGLFLLEGTRLARVLRGSAPFACAGFNALAAVAMLVALRGGTEVEPSLAARAEYITHHPILWRAGWAVWIAAALSLLAFYAWWGAGLPARKLAVLAYLIAVAGFACDLFAETLFIAWLPQHMETLAPAATLLSGGAANGLYTLAGILLTIGSPFLKGWLRNWAWMTWASGVALTVSTLSGSVFGMAISTGVLMSLLCPWVAVFGWKWTRRDDVTTSGKNLPWTEEFDREASN